MKERTAWWALLIISSILFFPTARAATVVTGVNIIVAPDAPSDFTAVPDAPTQVTLSWTDNSADTEDGFSIERKTGVGGIYAVIGTTGTGIVTYTDNTASADTTYFYRVRAFIDSIYSTYSNEASVTTPSNPTPPPTNPPPTGGGGGGGSGYTPPTTTNNNVTITGSAYPLSTVTILQNGVLILQTIAGPDGTFSGSISDFPDGSYNFYIYATDSEGRRSTPFTFPVTVTTGATTNISGIFLSPTISVDKQEVKRGDPIVIFGQTLPQSVVTIQVDSVIPIFVNTTSTASGVYTYDLNSANLALGSHVAKSETTNNGMISNYSLAQAFTVGDENLIAPTSTTPTLAKGDLNGDGRVDLVDFSILAYWYGQSTAPSVYLLDGMSTVDLTDFSIMAYYWTG